MHAKVAEEEPLGQGISRLTIPATLHIPRELVLEPSTLDRCDMTIPTSSLVVVHLLTCQQPAVCA
jgi:hypothetical protein